MTKSREQLEEEKRHALESRIEPLDMSGALISFFVILQTTRSSYLLSLL